MTAGAAVRVLIVEDHTLIREGIASLLEGCEDITVAGAAGGAVEALERCGEVDADVVLMDLSIPGIDGATATALLRQRYPQVEVVVLTGHGNERSMRSVRSAIQAGARACLLKTVGVDELADAIRGVTRGRSTFSSELLPHLLRDPAATVSGSNLTARERDILELLASGRTNKGIAQELGLTQGTVRVYVSAILAKLGVTNRTEATVVAIRDGLIGESALQPGPADDRR